MTCLADSLSSGETNVYNFWMNLWDWKSHLSLKQGGGKHRSGFMYGEQLEVWEIGNWRLEELTVQAVTEEEE